MSLDSNAREVLELCLAAEDPKIRSRVYEIIAKSGLDSSDPMFLVLALTGQIRVFLEAAPAELRELLLDWKKQNSESLAEIYHAAATIKENYDHQVQTINLTLKDASSDLITDIKDVGMSTMSAITEANSETLDRVRHLQLETKTLIDQTKTFYETVIAEKDKHNQSIISIVEQYKQISLELNQANIQINNSTLQVKKFHQQVSWAKRSEWFSPLLALLIIGAAGFIAGSWLTGHFYNTSSQKLGRELLDSNRQKIFKCINQGQSQCLINIETIKSN